MIAIDLLFVRMLCDYLKSRPQLEAEIVINGISGPEKNAQKPPADCNDAVSENEPSHGSRQFGAFRTLSGNLRLAGRIRTSNQTIMSQPSPAPQKGEFSRLYQNDLTADFRLDFQPKKSVHAKQTGLPRPRCPRP
jgi:hypothetical protein